MNRPGALTAGITDPLRYRSASYVAALWAGVTVQGVGRGDWGTLLTRRAARDIDGGAGRADLGLSCWDGHPCA